MGLLAGCETFVDLLRRRAAEDASKTAFTFLEGRLEQSLSYAELDAAARRVATEIRRRSLSNKQLLLLFPPGLDFIKALFGCLYGRAIAVPVYPPMSDVALRGVIRTAMDAQCAAVLSTSDLASLLGARFGGPFMGGLPLIAVDGLLPQIGADDEDLTGCTPDDIAYLQYTSGSTGQPRGVVVTHRNLWDHETLWHRDRSEAFEGRLDETFRILNWLPLYHDMGLIGNVFRPVFLGTHARHMSPLAFVQDPASWLELITRVGATVSGGPNFAYELCVRKVSEERRSKLNLRAWTMAYVGAEKVRAKTLRRFAERFKEVGFDERAFYPCYGLAEATLQVAACKREDHYTQLDVNAEALRKGEIHVAGPAAPGNTHTLIGCGSTCAGTTVEIVDPETCEAAPRGRIGEIWFHAPSIARGYWGRTGLSRSVFKARLARDDSGRDFLRTGDLGFLHGGELFIAGRIKDVIIVRGANYSADDIEELVDECHPAIRPGGSVALSIEVDDEERLTIVAEIRPSAAPEVALAEANAAIRRSVSEALGIPVHDVCFVKPGSLPKTSSGKPRRNECKLLLLSQTLALHGDGRAGEPPEAATGARAVSYPIAEIWRTVLGVSGAGIDDHFFACGGDSLRAAQFLSRVHDVFDIELPVESIYEHPTLSTFTVYLKAMLMSNRPRRLQAATGPREGGTL